MCEGTYKITANSQPSLLDLLLASPGVDILDVEFMEPQGNTDHVMINGTFDLKCRSTPIQLIKRNYKKCDYHLLNILLDQDWASLFEHKDMEENWTIFKSKVKQAVSASTPIERTKKAKLPLKTQAVALIKLKKEAWKKLKDNRSKTNWENYRKLENTVRKITREEIESRENET